MTTSRTNPADDAFGVSRARFEQACSFLTDREASGLTHGELEQRLTVDLRELVRQLYPDHLDLRAAREPRLAQVVSVGGNQHRSVETDHVRPLQTVFGAVDVTRHAHCRRGERNLYPADANLNLPHELHSHGLRELAAIEASRGSFEDAQDAVSRATGVGLGKRQLEQLAASAAVDFDAFHAQPARSQADVTQGDRLVLSADGKGIRDATRRAPARNREGSSQRHRQTQDQVEQGREAQSETGRGGRCRLRPHAGPADPKRHHRTRPRHRAIGVTEGEQQVAHRERGRGRSHRHQLDFRRSPAS